MNARWVVSILIGNWRFALETFVFQHSTIPFRVYTSLSVCARINHDKMHTTFRVSNSCVRAYKISFSLRWPPVQVVFGAPSTTSLCSMRAADTQKVTSRERRRSHKPCTPLWSAATVDPPKLIMDAAAACNCKKQTAGKRDRVAPRSHRRLANLITTAEKLCCILKEREEGIWQAKFTDLRERSMPTHRQNLFTDACNFFSGWTHKENKNKCYCFFGH